jgi:o-succinylbenzoate synthase
MKIEEIILYSIELPLLQFFETSFERIYKKSAVIAEIRSQGLSGWGECVADRDPFYSPEDNNTARHIMEDYLIPEIIGKPPDRFMRNPGPGKGIKGHRMAKAALNSALWDLTARLEGIPLWKLMGGSREKISCGVSIGIQDTAEQLLDKIELEIASGYRRIKIKIKPGWDLEIIDRVRSRFPEIPLMVDANSAYSLSDMDLFLEMDRYNLMMIEQPLYSDDIFEHRKLQEHLETPICLDESIRHRRDARAAVEMKACRIINIKQGRVGGPGEAIKIHDFCLDSGIPVWCGGMLETGIGRAHNIALSTLENFSLPGDVSAGSRYFREDIISPPIEVSSSGYIIPSGKPGIGHEPDINRIKQFTVSRKTFSAR